MPTRPTPAVPPRPAAATRPRLSNVVQRTSVFDQRRTVSVDTYGPNPLVAEYLALNPHMAAHRATAPSMFSAGDAPPFVSSGNDPQLLNQLHPRLRHAAAKANAVEWNRLFAEYGGRVVDDSELLYEPAVNDEGWHDYEARVRAWASGRPV